MKYWMKYIPDARSGVRPGDLHDQGATMRLNYIKPLLSKQYFVKY
jgi:hypothetical protein